MTSYARISAHATSLFTCYNACSESNLKVEPLNIAIPASLIIKGNEGLQLTLYVQLSDGFLSKQLLKYAIEVCLTRFPVLDN